MGGGVERTWARCGRAIVASAVIWGIVGQSARAASAGPRASQIADQYVDVFVAKERLTAKIGFMQRETERLRAGNLMASSEVASLDNRSKGVVNELLVANVSLLEESLEHAAAQQDQDRKELEDAWRQDRSRLGTAKINLASIQAERQAAGHLASLVSLDNAPFWLAALFAILILTFFAWHDRRHEFRRSLNGLQARGSRAFRMLIVLTVALFAATAAAFVFGGFFYDFVLGTPEGRAYATMEEEVEKLIAARDELQKTHDELARKVEAAGADWASESELGEKWSALRGKLMPVVVGRHIETAVSNAHRSDLRELAELTNSQPELLKEIHGFGRYANVVQSGIGTALLGLVGFGLVTFKRGVRKRQQESAATCPMCLGRDSLAPVEGAPGDDKAFQKLICSNIVDHDRQEECRFEFLSVYQNMTKLSFPTVGHPASGKTLWLSMAYRQLNQADFDANILFQKVKSAASEEFDRIVDVIINSRMDPGATQAYAIPHPLLFDFTDQDRWGDSNALLNIFDYSGEVTQRLTLDDSQRRRMLEADGYFFFLDPTQSADEQAKELVDFAEDVRIVRQLKSGQPMRAPVALCVSKIDLLRLQDYADPDGGGPVGKFYDELQDCDTGRKISRAGIQRRSKLVEELRHTIWPGWQIEKQIEKLFGGRFMYFPLTSVGLSDMEDVDTANPTELRNRTIAPRWILEPFMWLLDMNGYRVFNDE